jgi:uncharacterized protein YndB with AHSA1/START domain
MSTRQTVHATVSRHIAAPPERAFDAFLDPAMIRLWMTATNAESDLGELARVQVDSRVGGAFSFIDLRNGEEVDHAGEYLEINRPHRLVFTWSVPRYSVEVDIVTIEVGPMNSGSGVTVTHEMSAGQAEHVNRTAEAWTRMLDAINDLLADAESWGD